MFEIRDTLELVASKGLLVRSKATARGARAIALRFVFAVLLAVSLLACGGLKEATEDGRKTETAIKAELGVDAAVSFASFSGTNGTKVRVTVHLKSAPTGDAAATKAKVVDIVNRNFRAHVDSVAVSF